MYSTLTPRTRNTLHTIHSEVVSFGVSDHSDQSLVLVGTLGISTSGISIPILAMFSKAVLPSCSSSRVLTVRFALNGPRLQHAAQRPNRLHAKLNQPCRYGVIARHLQIDTGPKGIAHHANLPFRSLDAFSGHTMGSPRSHSGHLEETLGWNASLDQVRPTQTPE